MIYQHLLSACLLFSRSMLNILIICIMLAAFMVVMAVQSAGMKKKGFTRKIMDAWHRDKNNWKWGIFYYNPDDPRIFPPKRISFLGWTINFANPRSLFAFILMLAVIVVIILVQYSRLP